MTSPDYSPEQGELLSLSQVYENAAEFQVYLDKVGVNEAYKELYETYDEPDRRPEKYDEAFFAIGNKLHEEYEEGAPFWVDLLAEQRLAALRVGAFKRGKAFPPRRVHNDYRSGPDYPQDLYVTD